MLCDMKMLDNVRNNIAQRLLTTKSIEETTQVSSRIFVGDGGSYSYTIPESDVGKNSVVIAAIRWITDSVKSVPIRLITPDGEYIDDHPILDVLADPGGGWTFTQFLSSNIGALIVYGQSYLIPDGVQAIQFIDPSRVNVQTKPRVVYRINDDNDRQLTLSPEDVVHLRYRRKADGILGEGPLRGEVLSEIALDLEAQNFSLTLLRNHGSGMILMPASESDESPTIDEADTIRKSLNRQRTGFARGLVTVLERFYEIFESQGIGNKIDLRELRFVPEERICSAIGVPPALLNIGTGAQQTRVGATMASLEKETYINTVIPLMDTIVEQLNVSWLPLFIESGAKLVADFSDIPILQVAQEEGYKAKSDRLISLVTSGIYTVDEAREELGKDPLPEQPIVESDESSVEE